MFWRSGSPFRDDAGRYALTPESEAFLVSRQPRFLGGIFHHMSAQVAPSCLRLTEIASSGKPPGPVDLAAERAPHFAKFVEDLFPNSYWSAPEG